MSPLDRFTDPGAAPLDELPAALKRSVRPRPARAPGHRCELCGVEVPERDHRHVVDTTDRGMLCSCRGCALLFIPDGAGQGRYRTVPEDVHRVQGFELDAATWTIPVGLAFVLRHSGLDQPVALYPSPGGATESELPLDAWHEIVAANPALDGLEPDVEACLIRARFGTRSPAMAGLLGDDADEPACYLVPVDRCYELIGRLRLRWRGFDGGQDARDAVREFFADLDAQSRPLDAGTERAR